MIQRLAGKYAFSGGNIENIARKSTVEYVLSCNEEIINHITERKKIGF